MSVTFIDEFQTDHGVFRSAFEFQGYTLEFIGGTEGRTIGSYSTRQEAVDVIVRQITGVLSWDKTPPDIASKQLSEISRWNRNPIEIFLASEKMKPTRFSENERLPLTSPPRPPTKF